MQVYLAELKHRTRKTNKPLPELGRDTAGLVHQAYSLADQATRDTSGINAFMDAMPGPAIETGFHIIRGQPKSLQEAVAYAQEVDAVLEASKLRAPPRRAQVQQVEYDEPADDELRWTEE